MIAAVSQLFWSFYVTPRFFYLIILTNALDHPWQFASDVFAGKVDFPTLLTYIALFPGHLGWVALPIFFVVSGFCIHLSYFQSGRPSLKAFYVRRFFRIYPAYLLALLIFATVFPWSRLPFNKLTNWAQLGAHLLQCHNFFETSLYAINASYWTIGIEVQLYLLFPLMLLVVRRYSYTGLLILLGLVEVSLHTFSALFCYAPGHFPPAWLRASPFFFCFSWAIGAAMAEAYLKQTAPAIEPGTPRGLASSGCFNEPFPVARIYVHFLFVGRGGYLVALSNAGICRGKAVTFGAIYPDNRHLQLQHLFDSWPDYDRTDLSGRSRFPRNQRLFLPDVRCRALQLSRYFPLECFDVLLGGETRNFAWQESVENLEATNA